MSRSKRMHMCHHRRKGGLLQRALKLVSAKRVYERSEMLGIGTERRIMPVSQTSVDTTLIQARLSEPVDVDQVGASADRVS